MAARRDRPLAAQPWLVRPPAAKCWPRWLPTGMRRASSAAACATLLGPVSAASSMSPRPNAPDQVIRLLERAGLPAIPTGLAHGTVTTLADGRRFEITTLRRDVACDGRHAEVEFTDDFALDAARRDFTINAMSCDDAGRLYDYLAGARTSGGPGALRRRRGGAHRRRPSAHPALVPFFAHYGRPPADPEALAACARLRPELRRLSGERIQAEMVRLLEGGGPSARAAPDDRDRRARRDYPGARSRSSAWPG